MENEEEKLYIDLDQKSLRTPREFLNELIVSENNSIMARCKETYTDQNLTSLQCQRQKLRSFDDIYILFKTYFPSAEPKEVIHDLITLDLKTETGRELYPHLGDCSTINRIRFLYYKEYHYVEFCNIEKRNSKYSWKELLSLLEINNNSELEEYVKKHKKKNKECLVLDL